MNTDQARRIIALHDNAERALANLRNAAAMSTDDPRAAEMLESAGDAYAEALNELGRAQAAAEGCLLVDAGNAIDAASDEGG